MKALFALLILLIATLLFWAISDDSGTKPDNSTTANPDNELSSPGSPQPTEANDSGKEQMDLSGTGRTREIGKKKPQGLTATWHPEKKGVFISPYNEEEIKAIGVVSGSKTTDSSGNELIVPPFSESRIKFFPIGTHVPDKPGYVFNPFTQTEVDVRGIPPNSLVMDPNDPDREHKFRTPEK